ncbi:MAG: hypothetical protein SNJ82_09660 [Gemmataceae bacterium]
MIARVLQLLTASALFSLVVGMPARLLGGDLLLFYCLVSVAIVTLPAVLTLVIIEQMVVAKPAVQGMVMLAAGGVRLLFVLFTTLLLYWTEEIFQQPTFLLWVAAAYIYVLIVEVWLLLQTLAKNRSRAGSEG